MCNVTPISLFSKMIISHKIWYENNTTSDLYFHLLSSRHLMCVLFDNCFRMAKMLREIRDLSSNVVTHSMEIGIKHVPTFMSQMFFSNLISTKNEKYTAPTVKVSTV